MAKKQEKITKTLKSSGIQYEAWGKKMLKDFPITENHIGAPVKLASDPRNKKYILISIHEEGEDEFPEGGYKVTDPDFVYSRNIFLDEAISFPKKKSRSSSQLSRKKTKKKRKKSKKKV